MINHGYDAFRSHNPAPKQQTQPEWYNDLKFQGAYYDDGNEYITMYELACQFGEQGETKFREKYSNHLLCPSCHKAYITFVNKAHKPCLRAHPNAHHEESCRLEQTPIDGKAYSEFLETASPEHIQQHLVQFLNSIFNTKISATGKSGLIIDAEDWNSPVSEVETNSLRRKRFQPPHRKLFAPLPDCFEAGPSEEEYQKQHVYLYYGELYLKWDKNVSSGGRNKRLYIFAHEDRGQLLSLFLSSAAFEHIMPRIQSFTKRQKYRIAFVSKLERDDAGYWSSYIGDSRRMCVLPIDD